MSALRETFYPRNINRSPAVKCLARLDLDQNHSFLDGDTPMNGNGAPAGAWIQFFPCNLRWIRK
jgi:hypothetical protein